MNRRYYAQVHRQFWLGSLSTLLPCKQHVHSVLGGQLAVGPPSIRLLKFLHRSFNDENVMLMASDFDGKQICHKNKLSPQNQKKLDFILCFIRTSLLLTGDYSNLFAEIILVGI